MHIEELNDHLAECQLEPCLVCGIYSVGYSAGKDKAHFEVRAWRAGRPSRAVFVRPLPDGPRRPRTRGPGHV